MSELSNATLQPFLSLCQGAEGDSAVDVIKQCLEAPGVYIFLELLQMSNVQALIGTHNENYVKLLRLFAFGSLLDYRTDPGSFPELTERMLLKLKLLTLVSLASQAKRLKYSSLMEKLEIDNLRVLEDTVIQAIYAGIIRGKLDQEQGLLEVTFSMGRDIDLGVENALDPLISKLDKWCESCEVILNSLEKQAAAANKRKENHIQEKKALEQEVEEIRSSLKFAEMEDISGAHSIPQQHSTIQPGKGLRGKAAIGGKN